MWTSSPAHTLTSLALPTVKPLFNAPVGLLFYPGPTRSILLVADSMNHVVREVMSPADRLVHTIEDGTGPVVALVQPYDLAFNYTTTCCTCRHSTTSSAPWT